MMHTYAVLLLLLLPVTLAAQYSETIASGRPGQSIPSTTVGRGVYQVETGLNLDWTQEGGGRTSDLVETTEIRIGLLEHLELSALIAGASDEMPAGTGFRRDRGISDTQLGARYNFFEQDGWRPSLGLQGRVLLTAQDEDFRREDPGAAFIVSAEWSLTDLLALTLNLNQVWTGDNARTTAYAATLGFNLSDRWSAFTELYGLLSDGFTVDVDGGFAYLVNDHVLLDASAGWDGMPGQRSYYADFGISFRLDTRALRAAGR